MGAKVDERAETGQQPVDHRRGPTTDRLVLRAFEPSDAEDAFHLNSHPEVLRYTGETPWDSVDAARALIEAYPDWDRFGFGRWACVLRSSGRVIGFCGLKRLLELGGEVDLGYRFLPEHWGQGLATEASLASLAYARNFIGLDRVISLVVPDNLASIRVLEKVGMHREGEVEYFGDLCLRYATSLRSGSVSEVPRSE